MATFLINGAPIICAFVIGNLYILCKRERHHIISYKLEPIMLIDLMKYRLIMINSWLIANNIIIILVMSGDDGGYRVGVC